MSARWTSAIMAIATDPLVSACRYGFHPKRRGGVSYRQVDPYGNMVNGYKSCVSFVFECLFLANRMMVGAEDWEKPTQAEWRTGFLWADEDEQGMALVAHERGWSDEPWASLPVVGESGAWYVCQGYRANGSGHCFLLLCIGPDDYVMLEANGQASANGGPWRGLDGVGSRCCSPPNARDWPVKQFPANTRPMSSSDVEAPYVGIWCSRLH